MPTNVTCPNASCGKSYQVSAEYLGRRGRCKSCGTEFVFATANSAAGLSAVSGAGSAEMSKPMSVTSTARAGRTSTPSRLGRFQILERVGMGGFGAVYRAQDPQLQRTVALKLLQSTGDEQRDQHRINRFLVEGRAGARLQHPNIVPVFDAGRDEESGEYYLAAAFITGEPLSTAIDGKPMELRLAVTIVSQLARALEYAHSQGILHRDIKPDNVMLDQQGVPHLMDFGLARMEESESHLTRDGAVMGTPSYMSPEQCVGKQDALGPAADQYSLGCLFYELLTGDKLFSGPVSVQIHHQINTEAPAPSTNHAGIPQDLDNICLKTLSKEPDRRYASCAELATDLERWLADEPIQARQLTTWERWNRWRRRNPAIAGLSVGLAAALLIGLLGITTQWIRAESHARAALLAAEEQKKAKEAAEAAKKTAVEAEGRAVMNRESARQAAAANKRIAYSAHMNLGQQAWNEANIDFLHDLLDRYLPGPGQDDLRCFEWYYWWRMSHGYLRRIDVRGGQMIDVSFSPDRKTLATSSRDHQIRLWDVESGKLRATLSGHSNDVLFLKFSHDGKMLASGSADATVILWDTESNQVKQTLQGNSGQVSTVSFSLDDQTLFAASQNISIWNLNTGEAQTTATGLPKAGNIQSGLSAVFSPDNKKLAVAGTIWDVASGQRQTTLNGHAGLISTVAFSPDGKLLATGSWDHTVKLWDIETGAARLTCAGHTNHVFDIAFSPDGKTLASAGRDLTVRLWDVSNGQPLDTLKGHSGRVSTVAFSSDGKLLASAGRDYLVAIWDVTKRQSQTSVLEHSKTVRAVAFAPDSLTMVSAADDDPFVRFWDVTNGTELHKIDNTSSAKVIVFSPDGATLATGGRDNTVRLWELATGNLKRTFPAPCDNVLTLLIRCLDFSPDGSLLATNGDAGSVNLWNPVTGALVRTLAGDGQDATGTAFSPDGKLIAAGSLDKSVRVWDVESGRRLLTLSEHKEYVWTVGFTVDGETLASAGMDKTVKLWDVATGMLRMNLEGHTDTVAWLSFAPDGKSMATTSGDATVKLWDVVTGDLKTTLTGHSDYNYTVAFSPDGKILASGGLDKTARLWRAATEPQVQASRDE